VEGDLVTVKGIQHPAARIGEGGGVPPGSTLDRGTRAEKRTDARPEEGGTLNSGGPEPSPAEAFDLQGAPRDRSKEVMGARIRESDPPMVVGDGSAVHMAKGRADGQSGQSNHARERNAPERSVSRSLSALGVKAREDPGHRFRSLSRLLDRGMLRESFDALKRKAAPGIDGVSHAAYAGDLEANLAALEKRLAEGRYRATPVKRRWIPKSGGKLRPLGIPVLEDKIVQHAVRRILEAIWEEDFHDESIGYRPGRGARQGSHELREALTGGGYRWVVEADIRSFFDHVDHGWLVRMLEERIADRPLIRLIVKWLKAGVMDEGRVAHPATGTPQGGVISPILANIYLHHVMDQWIKKVVARHCKGRVLFRRYADDSVVCFEREEDAKAYLRALPKRLEKFGLSLASEKSALVRFDRSGPERSGKFTFLGFDFHWARARHDRRWVFVKRRTNKEKFRSSLRAMKEWLRKVRCGKLADLLAALRRKLRGYWNYYGVIGNSSMTAKYQREVHRLLYKWLNRRSQRRSMTWTQFGRRLPGWDLPPPRVVETPPTPALPRAATPA
jgi:RNA-directed DNA polymerase